MQWPPYRSLQKGLGSLWLQRAIESQLLGSCLGWGHPWTDTCWLSGGVGLASPWGTFPTSLPTLPLGWLHGSSLTFPASPCVGFSQSLKKTKTPPPSKSEKPGKSPHSRSLGAQRGPPWLDSSGDTRTPWR